MLGIQTTGCGTVTVVVCGKLDVVRPDRLQAVITAPLNRGDVTAIHLDITGVTCADSTGLGTAIVAHRLATAVGVSLSFSATGPLESELINLIGAEAPLRVRHHDESKVVGAKP